jgi:hypothetical protein
MGQFLDSAILASNTGGTQTPIDRKKSTMVTTGSPVTTSMVSAFASGGTRVIPLCNFLFICALCLSIYLKQTRIWCDSYFSLICR